jgi:cell division protein ZapE
VIEIPVKRLLERVKATRGPQFRLPRRFEHASFKNFVTDPTFPAQKEAITRIIDLIEGPEPSTSRLPWRKRQSSLAYRGVYLDGPPGIGKTHLLAAAFQSAPEPKLFATFDEFSAAAVTLGMARLRQLLASQRLVCIDEIDLRDPGNIMLLTSLIRAMLEGRPRILATANADPTVMDAGHGYAGSFQRELGEIAKAFEVVRVEGVDWRTSGAAVTRQAQRDISAERVVRFRADPLRSFLAAIHPMYDAAWLDEVDRIILDRLEPMDDTDEALRFVRFIDRVYDRDVALEVEQSNVEIDDVLAVVRADARFRLHYERCRSRLSELIASGELTAARITRRSATN